MAYGPRSHTLDTPADLTKLDNREQVGSTALIVSTGDVYVLNNQKKWVLLGGGGSSSGGSIGPGSGGGGITAGVWEPLNN